MNPASHRSKVYTYECHNERCKWFNQRWIVQVRSDGTIPDPSKGPKSFPDMSPDMLAAGRRIAEEAAIHDPSLRRAVERLEE